MVNLLPDSDGLETPQWFFPSGRQRFPLSEYRELDPGNILEPTSLPLLHVPLESFDIYDARNDVSTVFELDAAHATSDHPEGPSASLHLGSVIANANHPFACWDTVHTYIRHMDFTVDATSWDPAAFKALLSALTSSQTSFPSTNRTTEIVHSTLSKPKLFLGHIRYSRTLTD